MNIDLSPFFMEAIGGVIILLLGANGWFVRGLFIKVDKQGEYTSQLSERVAVLSAQIEIFKLAISQVPDIKTQLAIIETKMKTQGKTHYQERG